MIKSFEIVQIDEPVVSLELAKQHLRIEPDYKDEDELIQLGIESAQNAVIEYMQRPVSQKLFVYLSAFQNSFEIEVMADASLTSIKYFIPKKKGFEEQELSSGNYSFEKVSSNIYRLTFIGDLPEISPIEKAIVIEILSSCPKPIISAVLLRIADLYERREDRGEVGYNSAFTNLLRPFRKY